jgi:hypothetical protein
MAGIDPTEDPRGALWEARLRVPVLSAAWLALPTVFLYFSHLQGAWAYLVLGMSWAIWLVFLAEAVIMLSVVRDRRAWIRGHVLSLAILMATFPLLTKAAEALLAARALSGLQAVRVLQLLYLAKAAKLVKGLIILRGSGTTPRHPALRTAAGVALAAVMVGIAHRIVTGEKHATPLHATWSLVTDLPGWSLAVAAAGVLAVVVVAVAAPARRERGVP